LKFKDKLGTICQFKFLMAFTGQTKWKISLLAVLGEFIFVIAVDIDMWYGLLFDDALIQ